MKQKNRRHAHTHTHTYMIHAHVHKRKTAQTVQRRQFRWQKENLSQQIGSRGMKQDPTDLLFFLFVCLILSIQINKTYTNGWRASVDINSQSYICGNKLNIIRENISGRAHFSRQKPNIWVCARACDRQRLCYGQVSLHIFLSISFSICLCLCISLCQNFCPSNSI